MCRVGLNALHYLNVLGQLRTICAVVLSSLPSSIRSKFSRSAFDEIVTYEFNKEVLAEDFRWLIFINDLLDLRMVLNVTLKEVQWGIVSIVNSVLEVLSQRQFKPFALLGLSNLEPGVREPFNEPLQSIGIRMLKHFKILLTFSCHSVLPCQVSVTPVNMQG